jgi:TPP-dependent pyruvate/acetoin dehydrogenase alpha subunit
VTYRAAPHATADNPSIYVDADRVEEARENECSSLRLLPARFGC